jgi:aminopeptidase N
MPDDAPQPIRLADYRPPDFLVDEVDLVFDLGEDRTVVHARLALRRNPEGRADAPLALDGTALKLLSLELDGEPLGDNRYSLDDERLAVAEVPDAFTLDIATEIRPQDNTALVGLYKSGGNFCTQCEAEGFRRITYFPDRPDVLAVYTTTLVADKARYPVLLSNGNPVDAGESPGGRHWAKWHDPFPKPSYLFAAVAGDLVALEDAFATASGRTVRLKLWVRRPDLDSCEHAMASLKAAMAWDEQAYGLEYDLEAFNIVAVSDFNMGAMENKGLNVFNTALMLARPDTATDADYRRIESVVAHEYFHNWTGNRITCRDWFQLSLKEGLTVFRDQQFTADRGSAAVKRIQDVRRLRATQFPEDAGPTAHPVRPGSYIEINNFYTPTVYEKGAEVIRMMRTLLGPERFRAGFDLYVARHDGQAVTTEDFVRAMEDAGGIDLGQFRRWYTQAGTPELVVSDTYDEAAGAYTLNVRQRTPATPGQPDKLPLHMPLAVGLLGRDGAELPARLEGEPEAVRGTRVLDLRAEAESFRFVGLAERPVPSLLRDFSAPVKMKPPPRDRLQFLFANDPDPFGRWEAGQQLATGLILEVSRAHRNGEPTAADGRFVEAFGRTLEEGIAGGRFELAFLAEALTLPSLDFLADQTQRIDIDALHSARTAMRRSLAEALAGRLREAYDRNRETGPYSVEPADMGRRAFRNACLDLLAAHPGDDGGVELAVAQARTGANMTDVLAALSVVNHLERSVRDELLEEFYERWQGHALVVDKWFTLQAASQRADTLERVRDLTEHPDFDRKVPNRARALIGGFAMGNPLRFHGADGSGYAFLADEVLTIDRFNPQLAARLVVPLGRWRRHTEDRQAAMRTQLARIRDAEGLSKDVYEMVSRGLEEE